MSRDHQAPRPGRALRPRDLLGGSALWAALVALWIAIAGQVDVWELVAAGTGGLVATLIALRLRRGAAAGHGYVRRGARHATGMVVSAFGDVWTLSTALGRRLRGQPSASVFTALPFAVGADEGSDVARRVLVTVGTSLQPNSYVVGYDEERQAVIVHELVPSDEPPVADDLARSR